MSTVTRARWPFVGRQTEMDSVLGLLQEGSRGVLIYGDAGVGKSALARAVLAELSSKERPARVVRLPTDAAVAVTPWTVFAPMLVSAAQDVASFDEVLARVRHDLEGSGPVLLHVDDVHLLDDPSATVLAELVQSGVVTVLATTRHQPGPAAPLVTLWREGTLDRLDLSPLDHLAVAGVLTHVLDGPIAQETTKRIWEATNGKPLYLRELVLALVESEALQLIEGAWLWDSAPGPSRRLVDLVGYELAGLSDEDREVIELVALAGSIQVERIGAAVSDRALERVVRSGLVEVDTEPSTGFARARITHPVYAETVRSLIYPQRRRALFHRLSAPARQSTDLAELFHWVSWALQCGIEPEPENLLAATRAAASVQSTTLAIRMATEALQRLDQDAVVATEILLLRAEAFRFEGTIQRAQQDLEAAGRQLHELQPDPNHDHLWVRWAEVTADLQQYHHDDLDGALRTLSRAPGATCDSYRRSAPPAEHRPAEQARLRRPVQ